MFDEGYDMWIENDKDTEYFWGHETLSLTDEANWNFTWAEMGLYDNVANIMTMKDVTGADKVFYVGYSPGSVQMHYGMAHRESDFYADNINHIDSCGF